jgi:hypothetical protein
MISGVLLTAFLAGGIAHAQYRDRYGNSSPYSRGPYSDRGRYDDVVGRALSDLNRAGSIRFADKHERRHFEDARKDLFRFEENRRRGRFDRDRLDGAIDHLNHLVRSPQLHPRDREMLARNMDALRDFRARGGYYDGRRW